MALLNKLFCSRKGGSKSNLKQDSIITENCSWKPPVFSKDQIRVLLFRECDGRSRKLLFDSSSVVKKVEVCQKPCPASSLTQRLKRSSQSQLTTPTLTTDNASKPDGSFEISFNGIVYQYMRPRSDVKMLGEMIFGSVAMSFQGTATKIHTMRTPLQLMFSKVFPTPNRHRQCERDVADSLSSSSVDFTYVRQSDRLERLSSSVGSAETPDWHGRSHHEIDYHLGLTCPLRSTNSLNNLLNLSSSAGALQRSSLSHSGSYNSLQRRWLRCRTTSMEFGLPKKYDESSFSESGGLQNSLSSQKRSKLGVSVVFTLGEHESAEDMQFQSFFFSHVTLIESYINKFIAQTETAFQDRNSFVKLIMEGYEVLQQSIFDLYTMPRLSDPVWLSMMTNHNQHHIICLKFMTDFMNLIEQFDAKSTKFFMSTLLTAVLSHHLAWVPTVTPPGIPPSHSYYKKHSAKWLHLLAKSHPYNPLWVQLGDLYGANGFPCKMAKTLIIGKKSDLVRQLLYVLSYFIRCSEVYENLEHRIVEEPNVTSVSSKTKLSGIENEEISSPTPPCDKNESMSKLEIKEDKCDDDDVFSEETKQVEPEELKERSMEMPKVSGESSCDLCKQLMLSGSPVGEEVEKQLRPGRRYCESCKKVYFRNKTNNVRNGCIFDVMSGPSINDHDVNKSVNSWDAKDTSIIDRDSGISGCSTEEQHTVDNGTGNFNSSSPSKVSFTIGDVPLEQICYSPSLHLKQRSHLGRNSSVAKHHFFPCGPQSKSQFYVCSCHTEMKLDETLENNFVNQENGQNSESGIQKMYKSPKSKMMVRNVPFTCNEETKDVLPGNSYHCESSTCGNEVVLKQLNMPKQHFTRFNVGSIDICRLCANEFKNERTNLPNGFHDLQTTPGLFTDFVGIPEEKLVNISQNTNIPNNGFLKRETICRICRKKVTELDKKFVNDDIFGMASHCHLEKQMCAGSNCSQIDEHRQLPSRNLKRMVRVKKFLQKNCTEMKQCNHLSRSHSDDNLKKSRESKPRSRHKSEAALSYHLTRADDLPMLFEHATELPVPRSEVKQAINSADEYFRGFAWSLFANYSSHYMSDFALQGTDDTNFGTRLCADLSVAVNSPPVDEPVAEAICIIADTDKWTVQIASNKTCNPETGIMASIPVGMSQIVTNTTETLLHLWKLKMSPEFCLLHLEDKLQEIYFKSQLLAEYLAEKSTCDIEEMTNTLGLDASDLPLLMAVASTHSPSVTCTYGVPYR